MHIDFPTLLTGTLGFTIAIAWNTAVNDVINSCFTRDPRNTYASIMYAVVITLIVILVVFFLNYVVPRALSPILRTTPQKLKIERKNTNNI